VSGAPHVAFEAELLTGLGPLDAAAALHQVCFPLEPWSEESLALLAGQGGALAWHCACRGALDGFLLARGLADEAEVLTLAVAPEHQRRGLGTRMLLALIAVLRRQGVEALHLEADATNRAAQELYRKLDFHETGRRFRYYPNGADALRFRLEIR